MCTENDKERGGAGKGRGSKGCRGAEQGQASTKDRTGAVALRAALESAVQLGRGDEVNREAEMANPTKCRDSLQRLDSTLDMSHVCDRMRPRGCTNRQSICKTAHLSEVRHLNSLLSQATDRLILDQQIQLIQAAQDPAGHPADADQHSRIAVHCMLDVHAGCGHPSLPTNPPALHALWRMH
jgi:hypothetical protein